MNTTWNELIEALAWEDVAEVYCKLAHNIQFKEGVIY